MSDLPSFLQTVHHQTVNKVRLESAQQPVPHCEEVPVHEFSDLLVNLTYLWNMMRFMNGLKTLEVTVVEVCSKVIVNSTFFSEQTIW